ncbi:MAG: tetratricopeptide repeat protein [Acidobacteria bacterium]|nr:tetratricopeptide repeat protein [Acidobacteriota bacterium]
MRRLVSGRRLLVLVALAFAAVMLATPSYAQTGAVQGTVVDGAGKPLEKALVLIEYTDGINRKYEVKTNKKGEFIQIGLQPGNYKVTASFEALGNQTFPVRIRLGEPMKVNFMLGGGTAGKGGMSKEDAAKAVALKKVFDDGVAASKAGDFDGAIAKFTEASTLVPGCFDCFYNIGYNYTQKKDLDQAEAAFLKAIELKPTYVDAYNGLATVYNSQKKFDKAQEASQKAAELASTAGPGGGSTGGVDAEYNQGVIDWNAGKIPEAAEHFQKVIFMKPDHADAHYQMGMAYVNQGKLAEAVPMFEKYLELAPDGPFAATAKGILSSIKK